MSDSEPDLELLELLRQHVQGKLRVSDEPETYVLEDAEYIYDNSVDVAINMRPTKDAAKSIYKMMQEKEYSTSTWSDHELHPKAKDGSTLAFIFTMDLLNFSFWSALPEDERFGIEYQGKVWTGYWSLVAALRRALDEGIPITSSDFWQSEDEFTLETMRHVFRSTSEEEIPMIGERLACLREAGRKYDCSVEELISSANGSAAGLVNILARDFSCFRDEATFEGRKRPVRFLKRAQILVADIWACFDGTGYGDFYDIDKITMFADYRVPQILNSMGCLYYSPQLMSMISRHQLVEPGSSLELQLRGCTIWCVELIRREILRANPGAKVNAILIDFFLYDTMKEREAAGEEGVPAHHRTRSIWY
ncbi:probable cobyrinic acid a,c-diamide synthase [Cephalotrichum gorgonifer]|uniref:Queuosine 5'-phosphate N-glycosylase/hydrolase n=1 Tax=Cephalotrichum gorgonifer TaxID=2041049 RepID=A0AAE8MZ81_9PEZI|nr:probable cobyrinic acid a,c-diamide synthase [Cephalotrichum gorgonifer]